MRVTQTVAAGLMGMVEVNGTLEAARPLCPACKQGRLHPYRVEFRLDWLPPGWVGSRVQGLGGFAAVCVGNGAEVRETIRNYEQAGRDYPEDLLQVTGCGFAMPVSAF